MPSCKHVQLHKEAKQAFHVYILMCAGEWLGRWRGRYALAAPWLWRCLARERCRCQLFLRQSARWYSAATLQEVELGTLAHRQHKGTNTRLHYACAQMMHACTDDADDACAYTHVRTPAIRRATRARASWSSIYFRSTSDTIPARPTVHDTASKRNQHQSYHAP